MVPVNVTISVPPPLTMLAVNVKVLVWPSGSARIDVPDHAFGIPGLLDNSGTKPRRTARCAYCSWRSGSAVVTPLSWRVRAVPG